MGIEPTTFGLGGRCSTFELHGLVHLLLSSSHYTASSYSIFPSIKSSHNKKERHQTSLIK